MKKLWKRLTALALCALVLLAAAPRAQGATVYFMAVNDKMLELKASNMPTTVGGILYVPYTMLSASDTGVNLGVYAMYSAVKDQVLVYSNRVQLIFDIQEGQTYDLNGNSYEERAILRGSTAYIPISRVCAVFSGDIGYSVNATQYGYLVRVWNSAVVLDDAAFIDAASNLMSSALSRYQQENPSEPVVSSSSPAAPAATPSASPEPGVTGEYAGVYLAFAQTEEGSLDGVLTALNSQGAVGLFLLTPDQLAQEGDVVRKILGNGHFVGLLAQGESAQEVLAQAELGGQALSDAAHCRLAVVMADGLDEKALAEVERAGYACWRTTTDGRQLEGSASVRADTLARQLTAGASARNYLLLDDQSAGTLAGMLHALEQSEYRFLTPLATEL